MHRIDRWIAALALVKKGLFEKFIENNSSNYSMMFPARYVGNVEQNSTQHGHVGVIGTSLDLFLAGRIFAITAITITINE